MKKMIVLVMLLLILTSCSGEQNIYNKAQVIDVMNGAGTEKIGEMSYLKLNKEEVTVEILEDWYFNYIEENDFNWAVIEYADDENVGVYGNTGMVLTNVILTPKDDGTYTYSESPEIVHYAPIDGKLVEM